SNRLRRPRHGLSSTLSADAGGCNPRHHRHGTADRRAGMRIPTRSGILVNAGQTEAMMATTDMNPGATGANRTASGSAQNRGVIGARFFKSSSHRDDEYGGDRSRAGDYGSGRFRSGASGSVYGSGSTSAGYTSESNVGTGTTAANTPGSAAATTPSATSGGEG